MAWSAASVAAGGLLGYGIGLLLCGIGGGGGELGGGAIEITFNGSSCSRSGITFPCDELVARLSDTPHETRIVLFPSMGVHGVVQASIDALHQAGFQNVDVVFA